jgi:hypothetical protein
MAIMQSDEDGAFVREVLINRADADSRYLGYMVRGNGVNTFALQDSHHSIEYRFDSLACAALFRLAPGGGFSGLGFHENEDRPNVSKSL